MVITLNGELETALRERAKERGVEPEQLAVDYLEGRFVRTEERREPRNDWERKLFSAVRDCGVVPTAESLTSEGIYTE